MKTITPTIAALLLIIPLACISDEAPEKPDDAIHKEHPAKGLLTEIESEIVYNGKTDEPLLMKLYVDQLRKVKPELVLWCMQKAVNTRIIIATRNARSAQEAIDFLIPNINGPYYTKVDMKRMIRDVYREDRSKYKFNFDEPADIKRFIKRELRSCLIYRY